MQLVLITLFLFPHVTLLFIFSKFSAVYFLYDLSPITVTIKEERRSFLHLITRLCAVLGGTFALTGSCSSHLNLISIVSHLSKKPFLIGHGHGRKQAC